MTCMPSPNRQALVCLHWDGQIAVYGGMVTAPWQNGVPVLWTAGSFVPATANYPIFLCMESNGNLRATDRNARSVFWQSGTGVQGTIALFRATLTDEGAFSVSDAAGVQKWLAAVPSKPAGEASAWGL